MDEKILLKLIKIDRALWLIEKENPLIAYSFGQGVYDKSQGESLTDIIAEELNQNSDKFYEKIIDCYENSELTAREILSQIRRE